MTWLKENPIIVAAAVVVAGIVAYLAFGIFGVHTLFIDDKVNEAGPVFASGAAPSGLASDAVSPEMADEMTQDMQDEPVVVEVDEPMPEMAADTVGTETGADEPTEAAPAAEPVVRTIFSGPFVDRSHPTSGRADVLNDGSEQRFLRFENFETDNGPDLNVYLSTAPPDADAGQFDDNFVDLGDLKGNIGPQNYEIPPGVDLSVHRTVVIWCVRFGVAFGAAELTASG